jgi:hypothetical protein
MIGARCRAGSCGDSSPTSLIASCLRVRVVGQESIAVSGPWNSQAWLRHWTLQVRHTNFFPTPAERRSPSVGTSPPLVGDGPRPETLSWSDSRSLQSLARFRHNKPPSAQRLLSADWQVRASVRCRQYVRDETRARRSWLPRHSERLAVGFQHDTGSCTSTQHGACSRAFRCARPNRTSRRAARCAVETSSCWPLRGCAAWMPRSRPRPPRLRARMPLRRRELRGVPTS